MVNSRVIENLEPATAYYFVVGDDRNVGRRMWFLTAPDTPGKPFSIVAGGDSRTNRRPRREGNKLVAKLRPLFVLFGGDFIAKASSERQWRRWFDDWQHTIADDGRSIPIVAAQGNHEYTESVARLFNTPREVVYALTIGGDLLRVYTLNSQLKNEEEQARWMRKDIEENDVWLRMAQYHRPVRPHRWRKPDGKAQYRHWVPIFDEYRFALTHESDAHTVKTTWPIIASSDAAADDGFIRDPAGTVYIGEGCWGAPLRSCDDPRSWTRQCGEEPFDGFHLMYVSKGTVEIRTVKFENVDRVESISDDWLLREPDNLSVWNQGGHRVITVEREHAVALP